MLPALNGVAQITALVSAHNHGTPVPGWIHSPRWTQIPNFTAFGAGLISLFVASRIARPGQPFRGVKDKLSISRR